MVGLAQLMGFVDHKKCILYIEKNRLIQMFSGFTRQALLAASESEVMEGDQGDVFAAHVNKHRFSHFL